MLIKKKKNHEAIERSREASRLARSLKELNFTKEHGEVLLVRVPRLFFIGTTLRGTEKTAEKEEENRPSRQHRVNMWMFDGRRARKNERK